MGNLQLINFIKQYLQQGYSYEQIRQSLIYNGWPPALVDESIREVYYSSVQQLADKKKSEIFTIKNIVITAVSIAVLFSVILFLFNLAPGATPSIVKNKPTYDLIIKDKKIDDSLLKYINQFGNIENPNYLVYPSYTIKNKNNMPITQWNIENGIELGSLKVLKRSLDLTPGEYYIEGNVIFKGLSLTDKERFSIVKKTIKPNCNDGIKNQNEEGIDCGGPCRPCASCSDGIKNQNEEGIDCGGPCKSCNLGCKNDCNDFNFCTKDFCSGGKCINKPIIPCCGNSKCEEGENYTTCLADCDRPVEKPVELMEKRDIRTKIKELNDPRKVGNFCVSINEDEKKDYCFSTSAKWLNNKVFCNYIKDIRKKTTV